MVRGSYLPSNRLERSRTKEEEFPHSEASFDPLVTRSFQGLSGFDRLLSVVKLSAFKPFCPPTLRIYHDHRLYRDVVCESPL